MMIWTSFITGYQASVDTLKSFEFAPSSGQWLGALQVQLLERNGITVSRMKEFGINSFLFSQVLRL